MSADGRPFRGVDQVSSLLFPFGETFTASDGRQLQVFGISAITLLPPNYTTLLALCDRSQIYSASVRFNASFGLEAITWRDAWPIRSGESGSGIDLEGLTLLPNGRLLLSSEPGPIWALPPRAAWPPSGQTLLASPLKRLPLVIRVGVSMNKGLEGLAVVPGMPGRNETLILTALEDSLHQDAPTVRRVFEMDAATGAITTQRAVLMEPGPPAYMLTELLALHGGGLSHGGRFLALGRCWYPPHGNFIKLWVINATGSTDVNQCASIVANGSTEVELPNGGSCNIHSEQALAKDLVMDWSRERPLHGDVRVDNYEGMALVPPSVFGHESVEAFGGVPILLVNDNNNNPEQIGTQFVLARVAYEPAAVAEDMPDIPDAPPAAAPAWSQLSVLTVVIVLVASVLAVGCIWKLCGGGSRQRFRRFDDEEARSPNMQAKLPELQNRGAAPSDVQVTVVGRAREP